MKLRSYQVHAIQDVMAHIDRSPILVAPTGAGKTVMAVNAVRSLELPTLWLAHRRELLQQARAELGGLGNVVVESVQTMTNHDNLGGVRLIVVDEAHHAVGKSYENVFSMYSDVPRLGLTATPFRLDGRGLGRWFGHLTVSATTQELIDAGYLHPVKVWSHSHPNLTKVKITAGEYNLRQLDNAVNTPALVGDIVSTWQRRAQGLKTVVFAVSIEHSKAIVARFRLAGIPAAHLDGSISTAERDAILSLLRDGTLQVVSNCMVLTEGWDLPALECAVIARPTASLCLHIQMVGRIMRACDGKGAAIVLDHAGNHHVHGMVTRPLSYSLSHAPVSEPGESVGLKTCPGCYLMVDPNCVKCPDCGHVFESQGRVREEKPGELTEFDETSLGYRSEFFEQIEQQRIMTGYRPGWSFYRFLERFGDRPDIVYPDGQQEPGILVDPRGDMGHKKKVWRALELERRSRGHRPGWSSHRYRDFFGVWPRGVMTDTDKLQRKWDVTEKLSAH